MKTAVRLYEGQEVRTVGKQIEENAVLLYNNFRQRRLMEGIGPWQKRT